MGDVNVGPETRAESAERISQRPLVTFALFAYNQERYIREAIEGAFAQTYEPLEIIISDDCSTDRTFEIMQEMAVAYAGKAHIKLNRNAANLGVAGHVNRVIELSTGRLIVGAAGDDVSLPDRVQVLVDKWQQTDAWGLMPRCNLINEHGEIVRHDVMVDMLSAPIRAYFDHAVKLIHGATSAYDRRAFALLDPPPDQRILHEDYLLSVLLNATGKPIHFVDRTLVNYRQHEASTTNDAVKEVTATYIRDYENRASVSAKSLCNATAYIVKTCTPETHKINFAELNRRLRFYDLASDWMNSTFKQRAAIFAAGGRTDRRWLAPRIFMDQSIPRDKAGRLSRKAHAHRSAKGFFVSFDYTSDAMTEIGRYSNRRATSLCPLRSRDPQCAKTGLGTHRPQRRTGSPCRTTRPAGEPEGDGVRRAKKLSNGRHPSLSNKEMPAFYLCPTGAGRDRCPSA